MAKRTVVLSVGSGADQAAVAGSRLRIAPYYSHADGNTLILPTPETYFLTNPASSVSLTVGEFYWFYPDDPKGSAILAQIPSGAGSLYFKDLVPVDPATMLPAADPGPAWATALTTGLAGKQPLDADLTAFAALSPTNGQVPSYSTSLGAWSLANPTGASLNASNSNVSATPTAISAAGGVGAVVSIPSTTINVTDSGGRPVVLEFQADFQQTTVGAGSVWIQLYEGATFRVATIMPLPNTVAAAQSQISIPLKRWSIGAVTTTRTFSLYALLYAPAANNPAGNILNTANGPTMISAINL